MLTFLCWVCNFPRFGNLSNTNTDIINIIHIIGFKFISLDCFKTFNVQLFLNMELLDKYYFLILSSLLNYPLQFYVIIWTGSFPIIHIPTIAIKHFMRVHFDSRYNFVNSASYRITVQSSTGPYSSLTFSLVSTFNISAEVHWIISTILPIFVLTFHINLYHLIITCLCMFYHLLI